jgi:predicted MFS family arabinose efflux permease
MLGGRLWRDGEFLKLWLPATEAGRRGFLSEMWEGTVIWGTMPIGAFIGGVMGSTYGLMPAMYIGIAISVLAGLWILLGPIRLRDQPQPV